MNRPFLGRLAVGLSLSVLGALAIVACGGGGSETTAPSSAATSTPAAPTLTSLAVTCGSGTTSIQCTAVARLSDATTLTVTSQASWASSNAAIATVNGAGLVTAVATGAVTISATYQSVSGQANVSVAKTVATFSLSGVVTDGTSHGVLPNINVEAADVAGNGKSTTTSSSGTYTISGLAASTYTLTASAVSYQTTSRSVTLTGDTQADIVLPRTPAPTPTPSPSPTPMPTPNPSLTCNGASVPATVNCPNDQGIQAPTAMCKDGTYSCSQNRSGTCSFHSGVSCYVCPGPLC
jgi:hypothetical protein